MLDVTAKVVDNEHVPKIVKNGKLVALSNSNLLSSTQFRLPWTLVSPVSR
jgi:hypothetical protein